MWAYFNSTMMRVSLYRKQTFLKSAAGSSTDPVRPRPDDKLCPDCGAKNPAKDHECTHNCKLCERRTPR
ncbi:hypothetical protein HPB52_021460 [Rhipicephalus sanguineus]|uniref:Uncharacterized protein n=1 Tax=Rhipicephalus sanguineus TaxID=34632 RepID=A0A9D4PSL0_RHISA|nr:hypothetical protein HPB52_021460 [Rhipicephalus sanguineus]